LLKLSSFKLQRAYGIERFMTVIGIVIKKNISVKSIIIYDQLLFNYNNEFTARMVERSQLKNYGHIIKFLIEFYLKYRGTKVEIL